MSIKNVLSSAFALIFISLVFFQCEKDNETKPASSEDQAFLCYSFDAANFVDHFEALKANPYALQIKKTGKGVNFKVVLLENNLFKTIETPQPQGEVNTIDLNGKLTSIIAADTDKYEFQFWEGNFDFTLIPWQKIKLMAHYSDKLYISGTQSIHGASIHAKHASSATEGYFSFKIEGDFKNANALKGTEVPLPMSSQEHCPPFWIDQ